MACTLGIEQNCKECGLCGNSPTWRCEMAKCKYPNEVCANMTIYHGVSYCGSVPCSLKDEFPKKTNYEKIKGMGVEELAESRIDRIDFYCKSDTQMWTGDFSGIAESKEEALRREIEWLESECDAE